MATAERLIIGGTIVLPQGLRQLDLYLSDGCIRAVAHQGVLKRELAVSNKDIYDASGLLIFPGVIDTHVHFETGSQHCDTLPDVAMAAALGGTTTLLGHVSGGQRGLLSEMGRQKDLIGNCPIDVAFHAILTPHEEPEEIVPQLAKMGISSYKVFMAYQNRGLGMNEAELYRAFRAVAKVQGVVLVHAETGELITALEQELIAKGTIDIPSYPLSRPEFTEVEAIRRALWLAEVANVRLYIVHVSTVGGLELIHRERQRAVLNSRPPIYSETCPKYLLLNESSYRNPALGGKAIVAPPLRSAVQQASLRQAFWSGAVDCIGSDHSPHPHTLKTASAFPEVKAGAPGAQTFFPVMLSDALRFVAQRQVDEVLPPVLTVLSEAISANPARIFGLARKSGRLEPGSDADFVFVDPSAETVINDALLCSNSGFSLYPGRELKGKPVHSMVRGRWIVKDTQLAQREGGIFLAANS